MERVGECLESLDLDDRLRVRLFSWLGGGLLGLAWWLFIDACAQNGFTHDPLGIKAQLVLLPVGATLAFLIMSFLDRSSLNADEVSALPDRAGSVRAGWPL